VKRLPSRPRTWFDWVIIVSGIVPHLEYWGSGAALGIVALFRLAHGDAAPPSDELMQTHDRWPPVILPSWPFWVSMPLLLAGVVRSLRGSTWPTTTLQPWLASSFALFAGADGVLFALAFLGTPEWPRDSFIPGSVVCLAGAVGLGVVLVQRGCPIRPRGDQAEPSRKRHVFRSER
jgi:hypothetical protein